MTENERKTSVEYWFHTIDFCYFRAVASEEWLKTRKGVDKKLREEFLKTLHDQKLECVIMVREYMIVPEYKLTGNPKFEEKFKEYKKAINKMNKGQRDEILDYLKQLYKGDVNLLLNKISKAGANQLKAIVDRVVEDNKLRPSHVEKEDDQLREKAPEKKEKKETKDKNSGRKEKKSHRKDKVDHKAH